MWGISIDTWYLIMYPIIGIVGLGIWWELKPNRSEDDRTAAICITCVWPLAAFVGVVIGGTWLLAWIPRGVTRLIVRLIGRRTNLPTARVWSDYEKKAP